MSVAEHITIMGPGLLGASLLMSLRKHKPSSTLTAWARSEDRCQAVMQRQLADHATTDPQQAVSNADLVILCTPVEHMATLVEDFRHALKPSCVVTDVGSVKSRTEQELAPLLDNHAQWIGSHPMAGSEQCGMDAAQPNLFEGALCIITPTPKTSAKATHTAESLWATVGCKVLQLDPEKHDRMVAAVSHMPHLLAALIVLSADEESLTVAGNGFRDTTRIAAGPAEMWSGILRSNSSHVLDSLNRLQSLIDQSREAILADNDKALTSLLAQACQRRITASK